MGGSCYGAEEKGMVFSFKEVSHHSRHGLYHASSSVQLFVGRTQISSVADILDGGRYDEAESCSDYRSP